VREQYVSDCPGYAGRVGFFHWGGGPHLISIFTKTHFTTSIDPDAQGWVLCAESNDLNIVEGQR
jgi:hypothetical protein